MNSTTIKMIPTNVIEMLPFILHAFEDFSPAVWIFVNVSDLFYFIPPLAGLTLCDS